MMPTFHERGDIVLVDRLSLRTWKPIARHDVVIAKMPSSDAYMVCKRVVGLPGDRITPAGWDRSVVVSGWRSA